EGPAPRELRLSCGTLEDRLTVAPFRAWRGSATRVAQGRSPRATDPTARVLRRRLQDQAAAGHAAFRLGQLGQVHVPHVQAAGDQPLAGPGEGGGVEDDLA